MLASNTSNQRYCHRCDYTGIEIYVDASKEYTQAKTCVCVQQCIECNDTGFIFYKDSLGRDFTKACTICSTLNQHINLYNKMGMPKHFALAHLSRRESDHHNEQAIVTLHLNIENYYKKLKNPANDLVNKNIDRFSIALLGPPGTGKTHLIAGAAYLCVVKFGISCIFQEFSKLLFELRAGYSQGKSDENIIQRHLTTDMLIIDDLGKGRNTAWELGVLDLLISERYNNNKPIMITSNYTENVESTLKERIRTKDKLDETIVTNETLCERVGDRIYSRLKEMCVFQYLGGEDRRQQNNKPSNETGPQE